MPMMAMVCLHVHADVDLEPDADSRAWPSAAAPATWSCREVYEACGGHEALQDAVVDDVALARLVRRSGGTTEVVRAGRSGLAADVSRPARGRSTASPRTPSPSAAATTSPASSSWPAAIVFHILPYVSGAGRAIASASPRSSSSPSRALILFRSLRYRLDNALFLHPVMVGDLDVDLPSLDLADRNPAQIALARADI